MAILMNRVALKYKHISEAFIKKTGLLKTNKYNSTRRLYFPDPLYVFF